jgi:transcriptional regulator with XRE-family HTH domain
MSKSPNPIDRHVGARLRMQRLLRGFSQTKLGEALEVTFQQIQKYEKGANRIGASRLQQLARVLEVTPAYFFEGAPQSDMAVGGVSETPDNGYVVDFLSTTEGLQLNRAFAQIRDPKVRKRIVELVNSLATERGAL